MKNLIIEAWLKADHMLSEGTGIHLPMGSRLIPSARELLGNHRLRTKFIDEQDRLSIDGEQQQLQPVYGLTSSNEHPQACCELYRQPAVKRPDTLTHLSAGRMAARSDPRPTSRAVFDSTIALAVWPQIELTEPWQLQLADIRSRLDNVMRVDTLGKPLACRTIVGPSDEGLHRPSRQPLCHLDHDHLVSKINRGRDTALLNLLRTKVRETETVVTQVLITHSSEILRPGILQVLNHLSSTVYVTMILSVAKQPLAVKQIQR